MSGLSLIGQATDYYDYGYSTSTTTDFSPTALIGFLLFMLVFVVVLYAVHAYFLGRIFKKAGVESWKAWVPVYNNWVMLELGGQRGFWAILAFVPIVNIAAAVFMFIAMYHIGLHLGKEGVFVLLAIFVTPVWLIWLAIDDSTWDNGGAAAVPAGYQPTYVPPVQPPSDNQTSNPPTPPPSPKQ